LSKGFLAAIQVADGRIHKLPVRLAGAFCGVKIKVLKLRKELMFHHEIPSWQMLLGAIGSHWLGKIPFETTTPTTQSVDHFLLC
jgi:hypothetical protein